MINKTFTFIIGLLLGLFIGIILPISLFHKCETPICDVCNHCFWDWFLRVLEVFGTISAVVVALFKEWFYKKFYHPTIVFSQTDLTENYDNNNCVTQYSSALQIKNNGSASAVNCELFISKLYFSSSNNDLHNNIIITDTALRWEDNEKRVDISQNCTKTYEWFRLIRGIPENENAEAIPPKLFIGNQEISSTMTNGRFEVIFKIVCQGNAPQEVKLLLSWNGQWQDHLTQMGACLQSHIE